MMAARKQKSLKSGSESGSDPVTLIVQQEVEEFLRDLTLEYPFPEIFEILRRHEFKDRFGKNVTPLPPKKFSSNSLKEIHERILSFLAHLHKTFGPKYRDLILESFRYYTETTLEE
jgi:hypothetical protein